MTMHATTTAIPPGIESPDQVQTRRAKQPHRDDLTSEFRRSGGAFAAATLDKILGEQTRERIDPRPGDHAYLHLRDLRDKLAEVLEHAEGRWLDFGAGSSPYQRLLPCDLFTADLPGAATGPLDLVLSDDGLCPVGDSFFDGVLSTQVLEHVLDPRSYLAEAHRVLRPGGKIVLTTHGMWEDHLPVDLWRWTAQGLKGQLVESGFEVLQLQKLTVGAGAVLQLFLRHTRLVGWQPSGLVGWTLRAFEAVDRHFPALVDKYCDRIEVRQATHRDYKRLPYLALLVVGQAKG